MLTRALVIGLLALGTAAAAHAELNVFKATFSVEGFAPGSDPVATAVGVATVNGSGGGAHVSSLQLPGGLISVQTTVPFTGTTLPLTAVQLNFSLGGGTLAVGSGGTLAGALPVPGNVRLCVLLNCGIFFDAPLTVGGTRGVGIGGAPIMTPIGGLGSLTIGGAGWSTGVASVQTGGGTSARTGFAHGPLSGTSSTAAAMGVLGLVTPIAVSTSAAPGTVLPLFGVLQVQLLPEPGAGALLGGGALLLVWLGARRGRRSR